jgi:hypothetical protein
MCLNYFLTAVIWNVTTGGVVERSQCFEGIFCLKKEAEGSFLTL